VNVAPVFPVVLSPVLRVVPVVAHRRAFWRVAVPETCRLLDRLVCARSGWPVFRLSPPSSGPVTGYWCRGSVRVSGVGGEWI